MGAQAVLAPNRLAVRPGAEVRAQLTVTNTGRVVDAFAIEVLGPAGAWSHGEPPSLSLLPGQTGTAEIVFAPPLDATVPAGTLGFGVHVRSHEDPQGSVVEEGTIEIAALPALSAEMSPRTNRARGRRRAKHQVAVDNTGNAPVVVALAGYDDDQQVQVTADPPQLDVGAGSAAFVTVHSRGVHRFWRGQAKTHPFTVEMRSDGSEPVLMPGTLLQEAVVPKWLIKLIIALIALLLVLAVLWYTLFKPVIKNTATTAVNAALSSAGLAPGQAGKSQPAPGGGSSAAPSVSSSGPAPSSTPPTSPPASHTVAPPSSTSTSTPFSLELNAPSSNVTAPAKHHLTITDFVFQNPAADSGTLKVSRGGTVLITLQIQDYPVYDLHFITPLIVNAGQTLNYQVACANKKPAGGSAAPCTASALISGTNDSP